MSLLGQHGFGYYRTPSGMRWHRRYIVLRGSKLEIHGTENLEKVVRDDRSENINARPLEATFKKNAKPRRAYQLPNKCRVSEIRKTEAYVPRGYSVKQVTLCAFSVEVPASIAHEGEVVEDTEYGKVLKFDLGTESEEAATAWRNAISTAALAGVSTLVLPVAEHKELESEFLDANDSADMGEISLAPPEASLVVTTMSKKELAEMMHVEKFKFLGTFDGIDVVEELENPRTYISTTIVRAHPHTVFEELLLMGTMPHSDAVTARFSEILDTEILERGESNDVVRIVFAGGWLHSPRELVMERYWRLEEDGTYILNIRSIDHPACAPAPQSLCGWNPVRVQCVGGITISPLKPQYANGHAEAFITMVMNLTDVGGLLDKAHGYGFPYSDLALIRPLASNIAMVKKTVEASRFTCGTLAVMDRLQAAAAENRAQCLGKRQAAMGQSFMTVMAVAKFKKALIGKKGPPRAKAVMLPTNVDRSMWYDPGPVTFKVRGPDYFQDRVKIQASAPVFDFVAFELFECDQPVNEHIVNRPGHPLQSPEAEQGPYTVVVNLMIPGPPHLNAVVYFRASDHAALEADTPFGRVWRKFLTGTDDDRNDRFKLIPTIVEGSWVIKQAVGSTPVIMGRKLRTTYYQGKNYLEMDVDISNSSVACKVTGMCLGVTKSLIIDMAFCLEPHSDDELPECLLGVVRLKKINLGCRQWLPGSKGAAAEAAHASNKKTD